MRKLAFALGCGLLLAACALLGAPGGAVKVRVQLVDATSGNVVGGMVRVVPADAKKPVALPGLVDRLLSLRKTDWLSGWYVVPAAGAETSLPPGRYRVEALSGLETALAAVDVDVTSDAVVSLKLPSLFRPEDHGLAAGNTHLHLQNVTKEECDAYLRQVPAADGIRVMFISYLERPGIDKAYVTNRYPIGDLKEFATTGVLFNNGEEHRHNFEAWGQGYGHVMFLDIKELVKPVSLGPGIMGAGDDDRPLRPGIDDARRQGGTVLWCHNTFGHEDVPSALSGRLDALNVFDGGRAGTYEDNYYRYLNTGMRLPISTGTDWFIDDFSRVYAKVEGKLTVKSWLAALKDGRNVVTNGPILSLTVDGRPIGDTLKLDKPKKLQIVAEGVGRHDFQKLQLIYKGRVVLSEPARKAGDHYQSHIEREITVDGPGWFAARVETDTKNELGKQLFAHTSPVYVEMAGRRVFDVESARALLTQMEDGRADIRARGRFSSDAARDRLLAMYDEAMRDLAERVGKRGK
jgi:hypothetical protein